MSDNPFGAHWWRFDFHAHTPASMDYGHGDEQEAHKKRSPREWLLDFMRAEVDCVAITDHNTGQWITRLQNEYAKMETSRPEGFRLLTLFPGVEITVNSGLHMLAIFDPSSSESEIVSLLGAVGFPADKHGTSDGCTTNSPIEVAQAIRDAGGLAIPAHADRKKGLFEAVEGVSLETLLDADVLNAIEVVRPKHKPPQLYRDKDPGLPRVLGSDSHHPSDAQARNFLGSRFTWVKMGRPSLNGLRLALVDGSPLSVLRNDTEIPDPNKRPRLTIESIEVDNARYMGRGSTAIAHFSPWLSTIIGGRGTGKSTLIEMTRLGMRRDTDLPRRLQSDLREFMRTSSSRREGGAVLDSTAVRITLRKDDTRYRVHWRSDGLGPVIEEMTPNQNWQEAPGDVASRFPVRILSQKQVFEIANDPDSLLRLVDEAQSVNRTERQSKRDEAESDFISLKNHARALDARLSNGERLAGELADVDRQIALFEKGGNRDLLRRYQSMRRQRQVLDDRASELEANVSTLRQAVDEVEPSDFSADVFDSVPDAHALMDDAAKRQTSTVATLRREADELDEFRNKWIARVAESAWDAQSKLVAERYRDFVAQLTDEGVDDPDAYGTLIQRQRVIRRELSALESVRQEKDDVEQRASQLVRKLDEDRQNLTAARVGFLESVLKDNPDVQIEVVPFGFGPREAERDFLKTLGREDRSLESVLNDSGDRGVLAELFRDAPDDCSVRGDYLAAGIRDLKSRLLRIHTGDREEPGKKRLANHLQQMTPEQMDRLLLWWPEDALRVRYRRTTTSNFVSLSRGSPGQKSAAILAFLLSYGDDPIVLDQPEDSTRLSSPPSPASSW